jgi:hypothetical protein
MANPTAPTAVVAPANGSVKLVEYERYIDAQLAKTRRHVRSVDLSGSLMLLLAGSLAFFLAVAVLDHWVVPGGLGFWMRMLLCLSYFGAVGTYIYRTVAPLAWRRINPVYAAQSIERSEPKLKNSLINFLLFREKRAALPAVVYEGLEEQAATSLSKAPVEAAVDRTQLIHIGYLLLGVLVLAAAYKLFSPKDPLATLGRVIAPWADIQAPTRVTIADVQPGDVEAFRGRQVEVSASVQGLGSGQSVRLLYSTVDGQIVDRPIEMHQTASSYRHAVSLPEGQAGLEQDLLYRIVAGDATTRTYRLNVVAAPTLVASSVEYEFPRYTELSPQRIAHLGDIKALEGTDVTVRALANQPIKEAWLDFECDGKPDLRMSATGEEASVRFTLALSEDRRTPEHASYQLLLVTRSGHRNPQPQRYKIEVTPDVVPELTFLSPRREEVQLPVGRRLTWELSAVDPDFALKQVTLHATFGKRELVNKHLLSEPWRGQLTRKEPFDSKQLGLKAGDVVEYWAEAEDVKEPTANRTQTPRRKIQIVDPRDADPSQQAEGAAGEDIENQPPDPNEDRDKGTNDRQEESNQPQDKQEEPQTGDKKQPGEQDKPQAGEAGKKGADEKAQGDNKGDKQDQQQGEKADGQAGDQGKNEGVGGAGQPQQGKGGNESHKGDARDQAGQPTDGGQQGDSEDQANSPVPSDGTDDGSAIERILKHREAQGGKPGEQNAGQENATGASANDKATKDEASTPGEPTSEKPQHDKSPDAKAQGTKSSAGERAEQPPEGVDKKPAAGSRTDAKPPDANATGAKPEDSQEKTPTAERAAGKGGQAVGKVGDEQQKKPDAAAERPGAKGGDPEQVKGDAGDGDRGQNDAGSPTPQEANAPRKKTTQAPPGKQRPGDEAQSPSKSKRQSDSTGGEAGDNSGGGREGGGQDANRQGTGGAGRNTAAEEGGETSQAPGTKDDGSKAGEGRETDQATGKAGTEKGAARTVKGTKAEGGQHKQEQQAPPGDAPSPKPAGQDNKPNQVSTAGQPDQGPQSTPGAGSNNPDNADPQSSPTVKTPVAEVNLDYARKATELAIEHLKDQLKKDKPDPELLDRLGWSKGDLEQFVRRWEERRASASTDAAAGRELDEALRSLGLRERGASVKGSAARDDRQRGLKESRRTAPPADYLEQTRAYTEGTARGSGK